MKNLSMKCEFRIVFSPWQLDWRFGFRPSTLMNSISCRKYWLTNTGSPQSKIDKTVFTEPKVLKEFSFNGFETRRVPKK